MSGSGSLRGSLLGGDAQQPAWMSQTVEGSAEYAPVGGAGAGPAPWTKANARKYCLQMLWEQIRTVSPIAVFLIGYQGLVLQQWPTFRNLFGLLAGVCCVVVGLAIFMEGLKNGMMPLGEEVGMAMGRKLGRTGMLVLAFTLGILVTMAEPAIATLKGAGSLVHPDHGEAPAGHVGEWTPGAPFLYATVNLWSNYRLPITIGTGVGMACTVGILRSLLDLKMKRIIFTLVPIVLSLTMYIRFVASVEVRDILGLAWDCGAVTTGPVTVPLVLALGVGVAAKDEDGDEENKKSEGEDEEEEDDNWSSAFGVVTLASLFPVIVVLLFGVLAEIVTTTDDILAHSCAVSMGVPGCHGGLPVESCNSALAPVNNVSKSNYHCCSSTCAVDPSGLCNRCPFPASSGGSDDQTDAEDQPLSAILVEDTTAGLRAVVPLVLFLVGVLKFVLTTDIPAVALPDPLNSDPAAPKSTTWIHVSWGALMALIGMIIFYVGLATGLIELGKSVGNILPVAFTHIDKTPGKSGDDSIGKESIYCDADNEKCPLGVGLVALFSWFLGFGATCAEPALNTLGLTVERLTKGKFKRSMLIGAVSFGVATGITIGVLRLIYGLDLITQILLPGYAIALTLTYFSTEEYICVAWDSAGVTTGPITVPLVVSMGLGISDALHIKDGFGILACASVSPIISVLATGLWVNGITWGGIDPPAKTKNPAAAAAPVVQSSQPSMQPVARAPAPAPVNAPADQPVAQDQAAVSYVNPATQLRVAASAGDEAGVLAELASGANVDAADAGGQTSLYIAANLGNTAIVSLLINGNADVNKINKQTKFTPLMAAALCGHAGVVKQLLDAGADASATNKRGKTALDLAKTSKFDEVCALMEAPAAAGVSRPASPGTSRPASPSRGAGQRQSGQFVA